MADEEKKTEDAAEKSEGEPKKKGPLLWIILAVVLCVLGVAAGIFLAPQFSSPPPAAAEDPAAAVAPAAPAAAPAANAPAAAAPLNMLTPPITVQWPPLVVDVRDEHGGSRHIKIIITVETENEKLEEELDAFGPRGRQAVLGYVRAQRFEDIIDPTKFEALQQKITELVQQSVGVSADGKQRVQQVLLTDLVAQ